MTVYEDEIDLRPYILALIHNWWRIALVVLILASLALAFSLLQRIRGHSHDSTDSQPGFSQTRRTISYHPREHL
jgi:LPS O-antigen subunit length determinant protein (WzzB/FepE family)